MISNESLVNSIRDSSYTTAMHGNFESTKYQNCLSVQYILKNIWKNGKCMHLFELYADSRTDNIIRCFSSNALMNLCVVAPPLTSVISIIS